MAEDHQINGNQRIDVKDAAFYENVQLENESCVARMKKNVEVMINLRFKAAELVVENAALYHARLFYDVLNIQKTSEKYSEEEINTKDDKVLGLDAARSD